jgi:NADH-quinone oxidoreductase subunit E
VQPATVAEEKKGTAQGTSPTTPGRKRKVSEEGAPALREPKDGPKVSEARAEAERKRGNVAANANGEPNRAMRENATGAESPAGKVDAGAGPSKPRRAPKKPSGE